jgi:hypothetical protein
LLPVLDLVSFFKSIAIPFLVWPIQPGTGL